ncbi:MAG TPA: hypothetical protein DDY78_26620 [Planctomycetales bacterium]|jgi:hypothetical protein|nr:hypothetical protein [Planctomycetales bacterium]
MSEWIDRLAKTVAGRTSRRDALKFLGGVLAGGLLAGFTDKARAEDDDGDDKDKDNDNEEINKACQEYCEDCPHAPGGVHGHCIRFCKRFLRNNPKGKLCGTCTAKNPFTGCALGATCCTSKGVAAFCTNVNTDPKNCGACGAPACTGTTPGCCAGKCVDLATDNNNCGKCGASCATGTKCTAGVCQ